MKPLSDFTTPRRLMAPISRHFFPVEQPEPFCCTTGLKKGSRLPFIAHFLSSGLGCLGAAAFLAWTATGALTAGAAILVAGAALARCLGSGLESGDTEIGAGAFTTATFETATADLDDADGCAAGAATLAAGAAFEALTAGAGLMVAALAAPSECRVRTTLPAELGVKS